MEEISLLVLRPCGWKMTCSGEPPNPSEERFTRRSPTRGCVLEFKQPDRQVSITTQTCTMLAGQPPSKTMH